MLYGWFMGRRILAPRKVKAVSIVDAGANNRVFAFVKRKGTAEGDAMTKAEMRDRLKKADVPTDVANAVMEALNLLMPFKDKLPHDALDLLADMLDLSLHTEGGEAEIEESKMSDTKKAAGPTAEEFDALKAKYDAACKELDEMKAKMKKAEEDMEMERKKKADDAKPDEAEMKKAKGLIVLTKARRGEFPINGDGTLNLSDIAHDETACIAVEALFKAKQSDDARELAELTKRAGDEFPHVGEHKETARLLKSYGKDEAFVKLLKGYEAALSQLTDPRGTRVEANVIKGSTSERLVKFKGRVAELMKDKDLDVFSARAQATMEDPDGAEAFYNQ